MNTVMGRCLNGNYIETDPFEDSLEEQVRKEITYREELAKQLQLVRGKIDVDNS